MNARKKYLMIVVAVIVAAFVGINGCKKCCDGKAVKGACCQSGKQVQDVASVALCTKCGQIKGTDLCCKPDQPKCSSCGLAKGSPGCCKIPKDAASAAICTKCGQIKGSDLCCKPDQPKCSACGLTKGSPGCCKLPKL